MQHPKSCDTFVVLHSLTNNGVIFGKNSDRPQGEVQEIVYIPATRSSDRIQCTYIEVESIGTTKAVILSKPGWMWGAEIGANECGVAIGNQAVWTRDNDGDHDPSVKRLLGMDLVRLGLERASFALDALEIITELLETYGQGGPCSNVNDHLYYHNTFIIADPSSAWILETSGKHWAAIHLTGGCRNVSNTLTITTTIDRKSKGLLEYAQAKGFWDGKEEFNFTAAFTGMKQASCSRQKSGKALLAKYVASGKFKGTDMFKILRNKESGICQGLNSDSPTQGSQVSVLSTGGKSVHWFTGTPDPSKSVYKPFVFTPHSVGSLLTKCPQREIGAPHALYSLHDKALKKGYDVQALLRNMESECVAELDNVMKTLHGDLSELDELFKDCVETEAKFYR